MPRTGIEIRCLPSLPISSPFVRNLRRSSRMRPLTIWRKRWWSLSIFRTMYSFQRFDRRDLIEPQNRSPVGGRVVVIDPRLIDGDLQRTRHVITAATREDD